MRGEKNTKAKMESVEILVGEAEKLADPAARILCQQLVQAVMDLHGAGFERMLEIIHGGCPAGQQTIDELGRDPLVRSLLLLYDLHPLDLHARVLEALEKTRPYLRSHGGNVELIGVTPAGQVTLRLEGSCHSCPSSAATLQSTVEQAIYEAAPDVTSTVVEGASQADAASGSFVPLAKLGGNGRAGIRESAR